MKEKKKMIFSTLLLGLSYLFISCEKYLSIDPPNDRLETSSVFSDSTSASSAITGIYSEMIFANAGFVASQMRWAGLSSDELTYSSSNDGILQFMNNDLVSDNANINTLWVNCYKHIYQTNSVIEGVDASSLISNSAKKVLIGEARFVRAFLFFYLVNNWGDVPLALTTDYKVNEAMPRTSSVKVYTQIITDLQEAIETLPVSYQTKERVRPNKWAATALLARAQLYRQDWQEAESAATTVINSNEYLPLPTLGDTFIKSSRETIWQMFPATATLASPYNTFDGFYFIPASLTNTSIPSYPLSAILYNSFEVNDQRREIWVGIKPAGPYYFSYKYKIRENIQQTEYPIILRLSEQYLIRAEARGHLNKLSEAIEDLNIIRKRAGLENLSSNLTQQDVLQAVETERRHELFCEWGHRWFDLKRTGRADMVFSNVKSNNWQSTDMLWPIPLNQLLTNPFLTQNESY